MKKNFSSTRLGIKFVPMPRLKMAFVWFLALSLVPVLYAQGQGVVEGKVMNGTRPAAIPSGVDVEAIGLSSGMNVLKTAVTDSAGKYRIEGLPSIPAGPPLLIRVTYGSVPYYGQAVFDASGKAAVDITVYEASATAKGVVAEGVRLAFQLNGDTLRSLESYSFNNQTRPPVSIMSPDGNFRFSKASGIAEVPRMDVTAPGSSMPLAQSPLESPDSQSYYSLYPLRPGITTFEVEQNLPYQTRTYTYRKRFYYDIDSFHIGVIPQDLSLSGEGLVKVQTDPQQNFAVYAGGPVKAGTEVTWTFSGGTPVAAAASAPAAAAGQAQIRPMPTSVGQYGLIIGPLLLMGFILVLWYAFNSTALRSAAGGDSRSRELNARREQLLDYIASLDRQYENHTLARGEYLRRREQGKRFLRRIVTLLSKKQSAP